MRAPNPSPLPEHRFSTCLTRLSHCCEPLSLMRHGTAACCCFYPKGASFRTVGYPNTLSINQSEGNLQYDSRQLLAVVWDESAIDHLHCYIGCYYTYSEVFGRGPLGVQLTAIYPTLAHLQLAKTYYYCISTPCGYTYDRPDAVSW